MNSTQFYEFLDNLVLERENKGYLIIEHLKISTNNIYYTQSVDFEVKGIGTAAINPENISASIENIFTKLCADLPDILVVEKPDPRSGQQHLMMATEIIGALKMLSLVTRIKVVFYTIEETVESVKEPYESFPPMPYSDSFDQEKWDSWVLSKATSFRYRLTDPRQAEVVLLAEAYFSREVMNDYDEHRETGKIHTDYCYERWDWV